MKTQPKAPQWVLCSERMPTNYRCVLVFNPHLSGRHLFAYRSEGHWKQASDEEMLTCITHWLDCPDPEPDDGFEDYWQRKEIVLLSRGAMRWVDGAEVATGAAREIWRAAQKAKGL